MTFAEVAVLSDLPHTQAFSYAVPAGMDVAPGCGVLVPFGRQTLAGVVVEVGERPAYDGHTRSLLAAAGTVLTPDQIEMAHWLSRRTCTPLQPCIAAMLPPAFERRLRLIVSATAVNPCDLSPDAASLLNRITTAGPIDRARLARGLGGKLTHLLAELRDRQLILEQLTLTEPTLEPQKPVVGEPQSSLRLTNDQANALGRITAAMRDVCPGRARPPTFLLHGVTGSGKTEVYLRALASAVARGRRGLVLVPEIALTPQMVARFEARFPGRVATLHSNITGLARERLWYAIRAGHYDVVIGTRSAVFTPQPALGLIVIDEEHEWTLKQVEPEPRYHARDVAMHLAAQHGATLVLGSATPDVCTYARALAGQFTLLSMPTRVRATAGQPAPHTPVDATPGLTPVPARSSAADALPGADGLPRVTIVDLAAELRAGNRSIFSRALERALEQTLARGEQAILFLNRRGSASFVLCRDCGFVPRCSGCQVPFTVHTASPGLRCHQCNRRRQLPDHCPACLGVHLRGFGIGTQRVEAEVRARFPAARVLRWDRDAAKRAADHAEIVRQLAAGEADVVVGTQLLAKGLDIPSVTLVGVVSADIALNLPDFRGGERAFSLLTQVAGRAGRGVRPGAVIIQTYAPEHYAIRAAATHDYVGMAREELRVRREVGYPPFTRLARLLFRHTNAVYAEREARAVTDELARRQQHLGLPGVGIVGPSPAFHARVRGRWRWQIVVRAHDPAALICGLGLRSGWSVDIDPVSLV